MVSLKRISKIRECTFLKVVIFPIHVFFPPSSLMSKRANITDYSALSDEFNLFKIEQGKIKVMLYYTVNMYNFKAVHFNNE